MLSQVFEVGQNVNFLYPLHGNRNVLRRVVGSVVEKGDGPNGPYIRVEQTDKMFRTLSLKKVVQLR